MNLGKCPVCKREDGPFICSAGAVNCANCGKFIRLMTDKEREEWSEAKQKTRESWQN